MMTQITSQTLDRVTEHSVQRLYQLFSQFHIKKTLDSSSAFWGLNTGQTYKCLYYTHSMHLHKRSSASTNALFSIYLMTKFLRHEGRGEKGMLCFWHVNLCRMHVWLLQTQLLYLTFKLRQYNEIIMQVPIRFLHV